MPISKQYTWVLYRTEVYCFEFGIKFIAVPLVVWCVKAHKDKKMCKFPAAVLYTHARAHPVMDASNSSNLRRAYKPDASHGLHPLTCMAGAPLLTRNL